MRHINFQILIQYLIVATLSKFWDLCSYPENHLNLAQSIFNYHYFFWISNLDNTWQHTRSN